jgi:hypothetical protein
MDTSPKTKAKSRWASLMDTPPASPATHATYTTPKPLQPHASALGLLTPSTPSFGDSAIGIFNSVEEEDGKHDDRCTIGYVLNNGAGATTTGGEPMDCDVKNVDDSGDDEPTQTQFDILQQQIRDAELAAKLDEENGTATKRRSSRLAQKDVVKGWNHRLLPGTLTDCHRVSPPKATTIVTSIKAIDVTQQALPEPAIEPPRSSFADEAAVHLPPDANPACYTLDWQLQYPIGGSTHPSYPYPQMDPRLFFDPAMVPGVDGLPCVTAMTALVLPMGWRHITWSGFLPVVFDAYHQAFKLTPIGPLPLTCEEVQQGGLAKYVPGGEAHPEAGLLPELIGFGDGSEEVYNFDDVDWVLPWPANENFYGSSCTGAPSDPHSVMVDVKSPSAIAFAPKSYYLEARDCPDDVVDIDDAWRWLSEKCQDTFVKFEATPGKTWRGTGIHKSSKKFKQPIPSLLVTAIAETMESPNDAIARFLANQNGREFCPFRSVSTPIHVNIALLGDTEFTIKELLCYFPSHYIWRKGGDRLVRAGLTAADMTNMINMTRQLSGDAARKNGTVAHMITYETEKGNERARVRIVRDEDENTVQNYTAQGWTYDTWELVDYPILALTHGLITLPEGPDAGPLTTLIKDCLTEGKHDVMLSDVSAKLEEAGISSLIEPGEHGCPDKEVSARHQELLKEDRKRVLKAERERKKLAEEELGGKRKKRMKSE